MTSYTLSTKKKLSEVQNENVELKKRWEELATDEGEKAKKCRLCPHCGRVLEKLDGCDSMKCGTDYHGGNQQNGCGQTFSWNAAKPYVATVAPVKQLTYDLKPPESTVKKEHNFTCDKCKSKIYGYRFECINCAEYNLCEMCELQHPHNPLHIFKIL